MSMLGIGGDEISPERAAEIAVIGKRADNIFIASIVSVLFCCLGGLVATFFAHRAKQDVAAGNVEGAKSNINFATGFMIASFVIGVLGVIGRLAGTR